MTPSATPATPATSMSRSELAPAQAMADDDRALFDAVRPSEWQPPQPRSRYHLVVVGGGTAGLVAAVGAATLGAHVALVEERALGGDCLHFGCVPSKALLRCARAIADVRRAEEFGVRGVARATLDFAAVMARMRKLRVRLAQHDSAQRMRELGIDLFLGRGRFVAPDALEVEGRRLRFRRACIATGTRPSVPEVPGLAEAGFLTSETVFSLAQLPKRLAVVGGGPLGCELAQAFARFGSEVTLLQHGATLLPRETSGAGAIVERALERDGVRVLLRRELAEVRRDEGGKRIVVRNGVASRDFVVDELLIAVGRVPNVESLGLEAADVESDAHRGIVVDDQLRSSNRRVFAAGDVASPYRFTHVADATARVVVANSLFPLRAKASALRVPWCTYTDPEVARVGLNESEAKERGLEVTTHRVELSKIDRSVLDGEEEGFAELVVERGGERILGATIVSRHAGESISEITALMNAGGGMRALGRTIHPYPTQAEALRRAADDWRLRSLTPRRRRLLAAWFALLR